MIIVLRNEIFQGFHSVFVCLVELTMMSGKRSEVGLSKYPHGYIAARKSIVSRP